MPDVLEIAHRGYSGEHKDNTKEAFEGACSSDFDMIETDVQLTNDGKVVVYHDTHLEDKLIMNLSYDEVLERDSDIMLLTDFFKIVDISKIKLYLDVKGPNRGVAAALHRILKDKHCENVFIGCFNTLILNEMYKLNPDYQLGLITESLWDEALFESIIDKWNLKFVAFGWTMLDEETIDFLHSKGVLVFTYTCHNEHEYKFIKEYNLDGIVTDIKIF